ncbi:MAG TPA: hypothetical protein VFA46_24010 [Actinomycetes bacterium]|nr:hypothetical protein [Actinomycetes bacterium]
MDLNGGPHAACHANRDLHLLGGVDVACDRADEAAEIGLVGHLRVDRDELPNTSMDELLADVAAATGDANHPDGQRADGCHARGAEGEQLPVLLIFVFTARPGRGGCVPRGQDDEGVGTDPYLA